MTFHCLFEQSGTFKNVFKKYGHEAYDYDILNDYGETNFEIDLFMEIENAYFKLTEYGNLNSYGGFGKTQKPINTIFDNMKPETDFIIAFFPCTHFCDRNEIQYKLWNGGKRLSLDEKNTNRLILRNQERAHYYELYLKFCFILTHLKIPVIIENPASGGNRNYLEMFSPIDVGWKEKDRSVFGDKFKKPTNFFAINFEMQERFEMFYDFNPYTQKILDISNKHRRSKRNNPTLCR